MCSLLFDPEKIYQWDDKLKREDVKMMEEWMKKQPHLPACHEIHLILMLHSCYYSVEFAKRTLEFYITKRTQCMHIFEHLSEDEFRKAMASWLITFLPKKTSDGSVILFLKIMDPKAENFYIDRTIKSIEMVISLQLCTKGPSNATIILVDASDLSLGFLTRFNLVIVKHALEYLQHGAPLRLKQIHIINAAPSFDKLLSLLKPFMSKDLFDMIQIHVSTDSLFKFIPQSLLPQEYGGELPSCEKLKEEHVEHVLNSFEYFIYNDSLKVDESKRLDQSQSFGIEGTFKKLVID